MCWPLKEPFCGSVEYRNVEVFNIGHLFFLFFVCFLPGLKGENDFNFLGEYILVKIVVFIVFAPLASSNITLSQSFLMSVIHDFIVCI